MTHVSSNGNWQPNTQSRDSGKQNLEAEVSHLQEKITELQWQRDGYYGELQHARNQLNEIHGSKMWRLWMLWITFRRTIPRIFRAPGWILRRLVSAPFVGLGLVLTMSWRLVRTIARAATSTLASVARLPWYLWLIGWSPTHRILASFRTPKPVEIDVTKPAASPLEATDRRPRVLIVSPYSAYPPNHGGATRSFNLFRNLSRNCDLYLLIFSRQGEDEIQRSGLEPYCKRVDFHRWEPTFDQDLWGKIPPGVRLFTSDRVSTKIRDLVLGHSIDLVQLEHTELGQYRECIPPGVPVIVSEIDIAFRTHSRRRALRFHERYRESRTFGSSRADLRRLFHWEVTMCRRVDQVHTMSSEDALFLARFMNDGLTRMRVIANGVDTAHFEGLTPFEQRHGVVFVGNFGHLPNVDALTYFITDIWPLIRLQEPACSLSIVGANVSERVTRFEAVPGVSIVGEVPDVRPEYHRHRVMVAPIRAGSGTRLKILEAFAAGIPVVSTTLGAEGIDAEHGTHLLLADEPIEFADATCRLLNDDTEAAGVAAKALGLVREHYDWHVSSNALVSAYHELIGPTPDPPEQSSMTSKCSSKGPTPEISIVIPTLNGGDDLRRCLAAIRAQKTQKPFEIICVDSGSTSDDVAMIVANDARLISIDKSNFNHGLTRDLGASRARGQYLVFLNQDAVPADENWLDTLLAPLTDQNTTTAAVQGAIAERPEPEHRFYWDSCGSRFYFTRESEQWISRYDGIGFSTVHCAIRKAVWERYPFGWSAIMEDKKWQREVVEADYQIVVAPEALVHHTHNYGLRSLTRRCRSEGYGWRALGETYDLSALVADMTSGPIFLDWLSGLRSRRVRSSAEFLFPWLRPLALYWGNRFSRDVALEVRPKTPMSSRS